MAMATSSDNIQQTVSYTSLYKVVKEIVEWSSYNLLETLENSIADRILSNFQ